MSEKRKDRRMELESKLIVKRLDKDRGDKEVAIDVVNVSKSGVGFQCDEELEIGAVYEGFLRIWTKEIIHAFIEIIRMERSGDSINYGGLFIGMPEMESHRIDVYDVVTSVQEKMKNESESGLEDK